MTEVLRDPVLRIELYGACRWMESGGWGFLCLLGLNISVFTFLPSSDSSTILKVFTLSCSKFAHVHFDRHDS